MDLSTTINIAVQEIYNLRPFQVVNASLFFFFPNKKTINLKKKVQLYKSVICNSLFQRIYVKLMRAREKLSYWTNMNCVQFIALLAWLSYPVFGSQRRGIKGE